MADHLAPTSTIGPTLARYTRAIVSLIAAALVVLGAAITDDVVTTVELVNIGIAVVTAAGVYLIPTMPDGARRYSKPALAFLGAGLAALLTVLADGVSPSEWITVVLAALGAIGVAVLPNLEPGEVDVVAIGEGVLDNEALAEQVAAKQRHITDL